MDTTNRKRLQLMLKISVIAFLISVSFLAVSLFFFSGWIVILAFVLTALCATRITYCLRGLMYYKGLSNFDK